MAAVGQLGNFIDPFADADVTPSARRGGWRRSKGEPLRVTPASVLEAHAEEDAETPYLAEDDGAEQPASASASESARRPPTNTTRLAAMRLVLPYRACGSTDVPKRH